MNRRPRGRILLGKPGLDGHDRGLKVIARALRDDGFEVIYTGIRRRPEEIARAAVDEDVDAVGLSLLSGAHNELFPDVLDALARAGGAGIPVVVGGIIPHEDVAQLKARGIREVFGPGASMADILAVFHRIMAERATVSA